MPASNRQHGVSACAARSTSAMFGRTAMLICLVCTVLEKRVFALDPYTCPNQPEQFKVWGGVFVENVEVDVRWMFIGAHWVEFGAALPTDEPHHPCFC